MEKRKSFVTLLLSILLVMSLLSHDAVYAKTIDTNTVSFAEDTEEMEVSARTAAEADTASDVEDRTQIADTEEASDAADAAETADTEKASVTSDAEELADTPDTEEPADTSDTEEASDISDTEENLDPVSVDPSVGNAEESSQPLVPVSEFDGVITDTDAASDLNNEETEQTVLAFTSDVHNKSTNESAGRLASWIDMVIGQYGKLDFMGFCGDMADANVSEALFWQYSQAVIETVRSKGIQACFTTGNHEYKPGNYKSTTNPVKNEYTLNDFGGQGDDFCIYCLGVDNWDNSTDNYTQDQAAKLNSALNSLSNDKLIIVLAHFPLHSCSGSNFNRQTRNADIIIDALNQAAVNNPSDPADDREIIFLWGHNHTLSDSYYDEIYAPGNSIKYNLSGNSKEIQFYYAAAGCMSDIEYSQGSNNVKGKGLVITVDSSLQPEFAYYNASGNNVTESIIYPPEPVYVSGISLDKTDAEVEVGGSIRLTASVIPQDADNQTVYFSSSDETIATVTGGGVVKGISEGSTVITAVTADGGYSADCTVRVIPAAPKKGYIITIGGYALSSTASGDELVNTSGSQRYLYHGLAGVPYNSGDPVTDEMIWHISLSDDGTGYYIQSLDGRYLNASYRTNSTGGKTGELMLNEVTDVWTLDGSLDDWMVSGSLLKSTNAGKSLTHEESSQGNSINLFTVRSNGESSTLDVYGSLTEEAVTYTLSYDANGGSGAPELQTIISHTGTAVFTLSDVIPSREGFVFKGWSADDNSTNIITDTTFVLTLPSNSVILYAVWEKIPVPEFKTHSLTLSGQIGVNFFLDLPEIEGIDWTKSYMTFMVSGHETTVSYNGNFMNATGEFYGFTCRVNSIQMAEPITAVLHFGDGLTISETYSVKQYLERFDEMRSQFDQDTAALIEAIANYGHYIQPFLSQANGWVIGTDYAEMNHYYADDYDIQAAKDAASEYAISRNNTDPDIAAITYALVLDSETSVNVFFKPAEEYSGSFTVTVNGNSGSAVRQPDGRYQVRISNISAHLLGKMNTIQVKTDNGSAAVMVSAISYVNDMLTNYSGQTAYQNAAASLYYYYEAARIYKENH